MNEVIAAIIVGSALSLVRIGFAIREEAAMRKKRSRNLTLHIATVGRPMDYEKELDELGNERWIVKGYEIKEISLVSIPCNPGALISSWLKPLPRFVDWFLPIGLAVAAVITATIAAAATVVIGFMFG